MLETIARDLGAATGRQPSVLVFLKSWLIDPGFKAVAYYRMASWLHRHRVKFLPAYLAARALRLTGAEIRPTALIGPGLVVRHAAGVVVGGGAKIGTRCTLLQNSTLGEKYSQDGAHVYPVLGDDVTIGAGAVVLGNVRIGNGVIVGANSVVLSDVPPYSVVAGAPGKPVGQRPMSGPG